MDYKELEDLKLNQTTKEEYSTNKMESEDSEFVIFDITEILDNISKNQSFDINSIMQSLLEYHNF